MGLVGLFGWDTSRRATCSCPLTSGRTRTTRRRRLRTGRAFRHASRPVPAPPMRAPMTPARPPRPGGARVGAGGPVGRGHGSWGPFLVPSHGGAHGDDETPQPPRGRGLPPRGRAGATPADAGPDDTSPAGASPAETGPP